MQEKGYTNPADRGRFGFSRRGEFRAPYKAEGILVAILVLAALAVAAAVFMVCLGIVKRNHDEKETETAFVAVAIAIGFVAVAAVIFVIFFFGVRKVKKGFKCSYTANDETFSLNFGGDLYVINYREVQGISFHPRSVMGKVRGYDVTIKNKGVEQEFSISSDGYMSPRSTPFYIIQERLELLRQPGASVTQVYDNSPSSSSTAISKAELERAKTGSMSAMDRMAQLLGESSNMPELSAAESDGSGSALFSNTGVSRSDQFAGNMPSVGQRAHFDPNINGTSDGRETSARAMTSQGSFYVEPKIGVLVLKILIVLGAWAGIVLGLLYFLRDLIAEKIDLQSRSFIVIAMLSLTELILLVFMLTKVRGRLHTYRSDGRGMFITPKGKPEEQILYKDIISMDYRFTRMLGAARGYKVEIMTKSGIIKYDYMFPRFNGKIAKQYLPFEPIRRVLEDRENEKKKEI